MKIFLAVFAVLLANSRVLAAREFDAGEFIFSYTATNGEAKITSCSRKENDAEKQKTTYTIKIPSEIDEAKVTEIGDRVFADFTGLKNIKIPSTIGVIGEGAFSNCTLLATLKIPASVTNLGENAFARCRMIKTLEIPKSITSIPKGCFTDCRSLSSVNFPEGLGEIGEKAFFDCSDLTRLTIPASVTNIGEMAFFDCTKLTVASFLGPKPTVGEKVFDDVHVAFEFRASPNEWKDEAIPGTWQGHEIKDLTIETYRKLIFLPFIVGGIGTIIIMLVAIMLRDRSKDEDEDE
ncbi:MAG: leucine-rich repeat domain-containing protein [Kiritimatiellae bacterium]|nr:leucine-rich repeat domain-containing protein [Kiritimatiellia bacterium]